MEQGAPRTRIEVLLTSTDFRAAAKALAFRDAIDASKARFAANLWWPGGPSMDVLKTVNGTLHVSLEDGRLRDVEPGAGRMLGLFSVTQLPRRLALDFRDVTDEGLAFNSVRGDFEVRAGNAFTQNLLLKGAADRHGNRGPHRPCDRRLRPDDRRERQSQRTAGCRRRARGGAGDRRWSAGAVTAVQGPAARTHPGLLPCDGFVGRSGRAANLRACRRRSRRPGRSKRKGKTPP